MAEKTSETYFRFPPIWLKFQFFVKNHLSTLFPPKFHFPGKKKKKNNVILGYKQVIIHYYKILV